MNLAIISLLTSLYVLNCLGANLPSSLRTAEVSEITRTIGFHGSTRLLRSGDVYESWPGIKFGFEVMFIAERGINGFGDKNGTLPPFSPTPRFYLSKGLINDTELSINFFPKTEVNPITSFGGLFKYSFFQERYYWLSASLYTAFTRLIAFNNNEFSSSNFEVGAVLSRDYVRIKPYLGIGMLAARGSVKANKTSTGSEISQWEYTLHISIGSEIFLPLTLTAQLDFFNLSIGGSIFIGKSF